MAGEPDVDGVSVKKKKLIFKSGAQVPALEQVWDDYTGSNRGEGTERPIVENFRINFRFYGPPSRESGS